MKIFVLSDTHGRIEKALTVWQKLHSVDLIIHLGDLVNDAKKIADITNIPMVSVRGNNDFSYSAEDFRILETEYGNLFLTHGHLQSVKYSLQKLLYKTLEMNCKAALFGHTHESVVTESNGVYLINPGSLTYPYDGTSGSYAIVNTSAGDLSASICFP